MRIPTTSLRTGLGMTALVSRRAVFDILRSGNRRDWLSSTSVIARRAKPDVAIRFSLGRCVVIVRRKGMRIAATGLRTGLAMTALVSRRAVFDILRSGNRRDWLSSTSVIARRAKPDVAIRFSLCRHGIYVRCKGTRIPTTSLRTGLGMTALVSRRAVFNILRGGNRCDWLSSTSVIARRAKPDVAIRFSLGRCVVIVRRKGMRIPTTSLRTGLGMTG